MPELRSAPTSAVAARIPKARCFEPGDEDATHTAATAGVQLGPFEVVASGDPPADPGSDWRRWLADNGIDWDGPAA